MKRVVLIALVLSLGGCAPAIVGNWSISKYQVMENGQEKLSASNIGEIRFDKKQEGSKNIQLSILDNEVKDNTPFTWNKNGNKITISGESEFAKTWIVTKAKRKIQVLESTDGSSRTQTLTLEKK